MLCHGKLADLVDLLKRQACHCSRQPGMMFLVPVLRDELVDHLRGSDEHARIECARVSFCGIDDDQ